MGRSCEAKNRKNLKKVKFDGRTDRQTDGRMDGWTDGWTDKAGCRVVLWATKKLDRPTNERTACVPNKNCTIAIQEIKEYDSEYEAGFR